MGNDSVMDSVGTIKMDGAMQGCFYESAQISFLKSHNQTKKKNLKRELCASKISENSNGN